MTDADADGGTGADENAHAGRETVRARIAGRVQGVWFRSWTQDRARALRLDGWVRNAAGGNVEAVFSGPAEAVARIVADCAGGPPLARVTGVETSPAPEEEAKVAGRGFMVR
jgi:acylphosphatase